MDTTLNDQEAVKSRVLGLDLCCLSPEDLEWLHTLKNKAAVLAGRLQLKDLRANEEAA